MIDALNNNITIMFVAHTDHTTKTSQTFYTVKVSTNTKLHSSRQKMF